MKFINQNERHITFFVNNTRTEMFGRKQRKKFIMTLSLKALVYLCFVHVPAIGR